MRLADLTQHRGKAAKTLVVLAHPDDETVSLGTILPLLANPVLIYLTDGAPRDMADATRQGFADRSAYAAAREAELRCALHALECDAAPRVSYGLIDKDAFQSTSDIVNRLVHDLAGASAVLTHPYEHGHPDHDTAALAVWVACRALHRRFGSAPVRYEFASYHLRLDGPVYGRFYPSDTIKICSVQASPEQVARKREALSCFVTQRDVLAAFPVIPDRLRHAPIYDFTRPAPPQSALYDCFGWQVTAALWRRRSSQWLREIEQNGISAWV